MLPTQHQHHRAIMSLLWRRALAWNTAYTASTSQSNNVFTLKKGFSLKHCIHHHNFFHVQWQPHDHHITLTTVEIWRKASSISSMTGVDGFTTGRISFMIDEWFVSFSMSLFLVEESNLLESPKMTRNLTNEQTFLKLREMCLSVICNIYNMSGHVVSDIQTRAEDEWLYIWYNTDANVVYSLWYSYI